MNKSLVIVIVLIAIFGVAYSQLAPKLWLQPYSLARVTPTTCITPPAYPALITQSGTICPGFYSYGIGIGANNVKLTCLPTPISPNTIFDGSNWTGGNNGLAISGVSNVSIEGCRFIFFKDSGIFVGNTTAYTSDIKLLNITSDSNNNGAGIFVGHNVVNIQIDSSDIYQNKDGILFRANYLGPVSSSANIFPRGIVLTNNNIFRNEENGINLDAFDYYAYFPTAPFTLNNSVQIINNTIENNNKNGIQNIGFTTFDGYTNNGYSYILYNNIFDNGGYQLNDGSGIAVIVNKSERIINSPSFGFAIADFNYIVSNDLLFNYHDGIALHLPKLYNSTPLTFQREFLLKADRVFANYILGNFRHGISIIGETDNYLDFLQSSAYILQNDLTNNRMKGIYFEGFNYTDADSSINSNIICNDIKDNGLFPNVTWGSDNGVEIRDFDLSNINIEQQNIIERNKIGVLFSLVEDPIYGGIRINMLNNYLGNNNNIGLLLNNTFNLTITPSWATVHFNDFNQNPLQAFDVDIGAITLFNRNWWSDYSPTCVDNPPNGWCDFPRPIPIANQDIEPKAGISWGHNSRGYFMRANPGVVPKATCNISLLPPPPLITVPSFHGGTTGGIEPYLPDATNGGTTSGTDGGNGFYGKDDK